MSLKLSMSKAGKPALAPLAALAGLLLAPLPASAALIATATSVDGAFEYTGMGEHPEAPGQGTGHVKIGDCVFDGVNTVCTTTGTYVEDAGSTFNPGSTGTFTLTQTYAGDGLSPALGISTEPGGDYFYFYEAPEAIFELVITTTGGDIYTGVFPADPFEESALFYVDTDPSTVVCSGLPDGYCGLGLAGLTAGAVFSGDINYFAFEFPSSYTGNPSEVPLPAAAPLMAMGLGAFGFARRKKKTAKA